MKRLFCILICAMLTLTLFAGCGGEETGSAAGDAAITAEGLELGAGAESTLHINLTNAGGLKKYGNGTLGGFQFKVIYDPAAVSLGKAVLTIDSVGSAQNAWTLDYSDNSEGEAMVMVLDNNLVGLAASTVPLVDLPVQAAAGASGTSEIKFEIVNICDSVGEDEVRAHITDGSATITFK